MYGGSFCVAAPAFFQYRERQGGSIGGGEDEERMYRVSREKNDFLELLGCCGEESFGAIVWMMVVDQCYIVAKCS